MRNLAWLIIVAALANAQGALAQMDGKLPPSPKLNLKTLAGPPDTTGATVDLLCKGLSERAGDTRFTQSLISYERTLVRDSSNGIVPIFAPYAAYIGVQFTPAVGAAGDRGQALTAGQCGLAGHAIAGVNRDSRRAEPMITFGNPQRFSLTASQRYSNDAFVRASAILPPCSSGVHRIRAMQESPNNFTVSERSETAVTCVE
jgi:hypothetical protein